MKLLYRHKKTLLSTLFTLVVTLILFISVRVYADVKEDVSPINAKEVEFKARADDGFVLTADYYAGAQRAGGVIVLHDCKSDSRRYRALANALFEEGLHTLSLDLRGYGKSTSFKYSREAIKENATDIVSYQSEMALITTYWQDDLVAAYQFLRSKVDRSQGIGIVTSGCSSAYGVALAEKILLDAIVMITPILTYADQERYKNLIDIPSYFITSANHVDSYQATQDLFAWNGSKNTKMQLFKGARRDYHLIAREKPLIRDIAQWMALSVSK